LKEFAVAKWLASHVPARRIIASFNTTGAFTSAVSSCLGLGGLPRYVGDSIDHLQPVLNLGPKLYIYIWLVTAEWNQSRANIKAFIRYFSKAIREDRSLFLGGTTA
jgi:DNA-binding transcriptional LysR family regulator